MCHPTLQDIIVYGIGSMVAIADLNDPHKQRFLRGHDSDVCAVTVSPSGQLIASGQYGSAKAKGRKAAVCIWHIKTGKLLVELQGLTEKVISIAFSPDGRLLAASGANNYFIVWDLDSANILHSEKTQAAVSSVCWGKMFNPPNSRHPAYTLCSTTGDKVRNHVFAFDARAMHYMMKTTICQLPSRGLVRNYSCSTFSDDGQFIFCGTEAGEVMVFLASASVYRTCIPISSNGVRGLASIDQFLYAGAGDGIIKKLSGADKKWFVEADCKLEGRVMSLSVASGYKELVAGTQTGRMYRVSSSTLKPTEIAESHRDNIVAVASGAQPDVFATLSEKGDLFFWDLTDYIVTARAKGSSKGASLILTDDGVAVTGWSDGFIRGYDTKSGQEMWSIPRAHRGAVTRLASTKEYLVSGGSDGCIRLWSHSSHRMFTSVGLHKGAITGLLVDINDPTLIHSCGTDKVVVSYNIKEEGIQVTHSIKNGAFTSLSQRKDSENELVTATEYGIVFVSIETRLSGSFEDFISVLKTCLYFVPLTFFCAPLLFCYIPHLWY